MESTYRRWPQRILWIFSVCVVIFFACRAYYRWTDDFRLANITHEMPYKAEWDTSFSPAEHARLAVILHQPFSYVGKGAQAYAFANPDQTYVIKFFKFKHLKPNAWVEMLDGLPFITEYNTWQSARKERLILSVFAGHKLAYDLHRPESGLLFLHLNKTTNLGLQAHLIDKLRFNRSVNLDDVIFVVQEYAQTTRQALTAALDSDNIGLAKQRINQIIDLYLSEYSKGIYDRDHGVMHNTGFVGQKPIHLDVGKLTHDESMRELANYQPDLIKVVNKFEIWLRKNYPQDYPELISFLEDRLTEIFGEKFVFGQ